MTVMVTSIGDAWYLAHRLDDNPCHDNNGDRLHDPLCGASDAECRNSGPAIVPFGDPIASLRVACQMAARMNARRAA